MFQNSEELTIVEQIKKMPVRIHFANQSIGKYQTW
jgi:hypothetical protein